MVVPERLLYIEVIVNPDLSSWPFYVACDCSSEVVGIMKVSERFFRVVLLLVVLVYNKYVNDIPTDSP